MITKVINTKLIIPVLFILGYMSMALENAPLAERILSKRKVKDIERSRKLDCRPMITVA